MSDQRLEKRRERLKLLGRFINRPEALQVLVLPGEGLANALDPGAQIERENFLLSSEIRAQLSGVGSDRRALAL